MGIDLFESMNFAVSVPSSLLKSHVSILVPVADRDSTAAQYTVNSYLMTC